MTQEKGIPYQRHKPSAALREFLDPLDPGAYFDCGRARLHGLDDALLKEAESRGRQVGDDSFQLVATDMGLIFCRPSISFAIAARWEEALLIRPHGDDPVVLPVTWPTHGELKFTVSKRLAGNIFRRWLQLRMQTARLERNETAERNAVAGQTRAPSEPVVIDSPEGVAVYVPGDGAKVGTDAPTVLSADAVADDADADVAAGDVLIGPAQAETETDGTNETNETDSSEEVVSSNEVEPAEPIEPANQAEQADPSEQAKPSETLAAEPEDATSAEPVIDDETVDGEAVDGAEDVDDGAVSSDGESAEAADPAQAAAQEWEVVAKVDPPAEPEPASESSVVERRDTGVSSKRKKLDERGAAKRRSDRQLLQATFEAETSLPLGDAPSTDSESTDGGSTDAGSAETDSADAGPGGAQSGDPDLSRPSVLEEVADDAESGGPAATDQHAWPDQRKHRKAVAASAAVLAEEPAVLDESADQESARDAVIDLDAPAPSEADAVAETAAGSSSDDANGTEGSTSDGEHERVGEFHGGAIRTIAKPETTPPSWVGSPLSLVAAVVAVSSFVLVTTLVASIYRGGGEDDAESASPAGPSVPTTIDHQRFKPGAESSVPLRSAALTPTGSSVVGSTAPGLAGTGSDDADQEDDSSDGNVVSSNEPRLCNSNYSGCVADVSDVDCPGDGDGPVFSEGSAIVMGEDVYELDTDGDGETCEPGQPRLEALGDGDGDSDRENGDQESSSAGLVPESP